MIRTKIGSFKLLLQLLLTLARAHNVCTLSMYSQMENFAVIITVSNVAIIEIIVFVVERRAILPIELR